MMLFELRRPRNVFVNTNSQIREVLGSCDARLHFNFVALQQLESEQHPLQSLCRTHLNFIGRIAPVHLSGRALWGGRFALIAAFRRLHGRRKHCAERILRGATEESTAQRKPLILPLKGDRRLTGTRFVCGVALKCFNREIWSASPQPPTTSTITWALTKLMD